VNGANIAGFLKVANLFCVERHAGRDSILPAFCCWRQSGNCTACRTVTAS